MSVESREKNFFDKQWREVHVRKIEGQIKIPGVDTLKDKRVLICSCGKGRLTTLAAMQGADTYAFDISETAVDNAKKFAEFNEVNIEAEVMSFHNLAYKENFFDIVHGSYILHHVDCELAGSEIFRVLKPGGIAFFYENSDRNPLLRYLRRLIFGKPGGYQRQKVLFFERMGTTDEYPLTKKSLETLSNIFRGSLRIYNEKFIFFSLITRMTLRNKRLHQLAKKLDTLIGKAFPSLLEYSFYQGVWLRKVLH